ncbi:MAG: DUF1722 domain-containing protein [Proteobacteria bacterium]|nr:DUF1722 domain-containing protein [Pseudomonadota bacterium]
MRNFARPRLFASRCLGFEACRWNGVTIPDRFVESLAPHVDFVTSCPEVEVGLGVPRDPIRIVASGADRRLVQPATGRDVSEVMRACVARILDSLPDVDGFLLKSRSPSCGLRDVRLYPREGKVAAVTSKGQGFFGGEVLARFPHKAVEDEARIMDFRIRENFLTKLFAIADFRTVRASGAMRDLVDFHSRNKYMLMAYSQRQLSVLGNIVANAERAAPAEVIARYAAELCKGCERSPRYTSNINALMHAFGHLSKGLGGGERAYFLETLEAYRKSRVPLSVPLSILRSFVVRFGDSYLMAQTFFEPFPEDLVTVTDSGKGRERR